MARARAARRGARREAQGGRRVRSRAAAAPVTRRRLLEQAAQHVREDAAVPQVLALLRRVEAQARAELLVVGPYRDLGRLGVLDAEDREALAAGEAERLAALPLGELQR